MGAETNITLNRRQDSFPKVGAKLTLNISGRPTSADRFSTERGRLKSLTIYVTTAELPDHVAERGIETMMKPLKGYGVPVVPVYQRLDSKGAGAQQSCLLPNVKTG